MAAMMLGKSKGAPGTTPTVANGDSKSTGNIKNIGPKKLGIDMFKTRRMNLMPFVRGWGRCKSSVDAVAADPVVELRREATSSGASVNLNTHHPVQRILDPPESTNSNGVNSQIGLRHQLGASAARDSANSADVTFSPLSDTVDEAPSPCAHGATAPVTSSTTTYANPTISFREKSIRFNCSYSSIYSSIHLLSESDTALLTDDLSQPTTTDSDDSDDPEALEGMFDLQSRRQTTFSFSTMSPSLGSSRSSTSSLHPQIDSRDETDRADLATSSRPIPTPSLKRSVASPTRSSSMRISTQTPLPDWFNRTNVSLAYVGHGYCDVSLEETDDNCDACITI